MNVFVKTVGCAYIIFKKNMFFAKKKTAAEEDTSLMFYVGIGIIFAVAIIAVTALK